MEELQSEEREVILSIYDCDPAFKQLSPVTYQYKYGEEGDPRSFLLELTWGKEYPNEPPQINLNTFYNKHINDVAKNRVSQFLIQEAENLLGCAMTYSLFECIKEKHFELIGTADANEGNQEETKKETSSAGEEEDEEGETGPSGGGGGGGRVRKEQLTKAQKRRAWNRLDCHGEKPRGWNWIDVIHHLSQTGSKKTDNPSS